MYSNFFLIYKIKIKKMIIKKLDEFINENKRIQLSSPGKQPTDIMARQADDFYDYVTRDRFRGLSKYDLNSKVFELASRKDEIGILAQFCLQIERASILSDDNLIKSLEDLSNKLNIEIENIDTIKRQEDERAYQSKQIYIELSQNIQKIKDEIRGGTKMNPEQGDI